MTTTKSNHPSLTTNDNNSNNTASDSSSSLQAEDEDEERQRPPRRQSRLAKKMAKLRSRRREERNAARQNEETHSEQETNVIHLRWNRDKPLCEGKDEDRDSVYELTQSEEEKEEVIHQAAKDIDLFHHCCPCNQIAQDLEVENGNDQVDNTLLDSKVSDIAVKRNVGTPTCSLYDPLDDNTSDLTSSPPPPVSSQSSSPGGSPANSSFYPLESLKALIGSKSLLFTAARISRKLNQANVSTNLKETQPKSLGNITKVTPSSEFAQKESSDSIVANSKLPEPPTVASIREGVSHLTRLDDFNVVNLSHGFFSQVFKVTHFATKKVMVLKMNKETGNRGNALKEIELLNKLNHRNIVAYMGTVVHEGALHPLLEYINAGTLEQLIGQFYGREITANGTLVANCGNGPVQYFGGNAALTNGAFLSIPIKRGAISPKVHLLNNPDRTFLKLMADVARGMDYLHAMGYLHRDLASKNIFIRKLPPKGEGEAKGLDITSTDPVHSLNIDAYLEDYFDDDRLEAVIGDFGFAIGEPVLDGPKLSTVGSPYWMAPECFGGRWYNHKCDIYSFGVVACELNWRMPADPDYLPRVDGNFSIDFSKLPTTKMNTPLAEAARLACRVDPDARPEFSEILTMLEKELGRKTPDLSTTLSQRAEEVSKFVWRRGNSLELFNTGNGDIFDQHLFRRRCSVQGQKPT